MIVAISGLILPQVKSIMYSLMDKLTLNKWLVHYICVKIHLDGLYFECLMLSQSITIFTSQLYLFVIIRLGCGLRFHLDFNQMNE